MGGAGGGYLLHRNPETLPPMTQFLMFIVLMLVAIMAGCLSGCSSSTVTGNSVSLTVNLLTP